MVIPHIDYDVSVPLVTSLVVRRMRRADIRMLCIKGPFLSAQELRSQRRSMDLDIIVHPQDLDAVSTILIDEGWQQRDPEWQPQAYAPYSVTFTHDYWPTSIDVHFRWTGFFGEPGPHFDRLWEARTEIRLTQTDCPVPCREHHALIYVLNMLRGTSRTAAHTALESVSRKLETWWDDPSEERDAQWFRTQVTSFNAEQSARPLLERLGFNVPEPRTISSELREWQLRTLVGGSYTAGWLERISLAPLHRKVQLVVDATGLNPKVLRSYRPDAPPGFVSYWRTWFQRLRKGIRDYRKIRADRRR